MALPTISQLMADTVPKSTSVKGGARIEKTLRNLNRMAEQNAPAEDIMVYIKSEGYDPKSFSNAVENYNKSKGVIAEFGPVKSALQGLTFGFSDEAEAGIKSLLGQGTYEQNLAAINLAKQEYQQQQPLEAIGSELAGTIPTMLLGGAGAVRGQQILERTMPMLRNIPRSATAIGGAGAAGGISAGVTGAGQAMPGERMAGAGELAPVGAALGLGGTTAARVIPQVPGVQPMMDLGRRLVGRAPDFAQRADVKLLQALQRDGISPADAIDRIQKIKAAGYKPETIIELGGENTRRLADVVAQYPGPAQAARALAEERTAGQAQRVMSDFTQAFRTNADAVDLTDNLITARTQISDPLYKKAYAEGGVIEDPRFNDFMKIPQFKEAYQTARRLAALDRIELPANVEDIAKVGGFDLMTLDYIKRGLDDILYTKSSPLSGVGKTELGKLKQRRNEFVSVIDEVGPESYKEARRAFAGPTEVIDAIEKGRKFANLDSREIKRIYAGLSEAEKDGFKIGVYDTIRATINKGADGRDVLTRVWGSPEKRNQIQVLLGEDAYNTLTSQLAREKLIRQTDAKLAGGSQTMPRQLAQREFEGEEGLIPSVVERGPIRGGIDYVLRTATGPGQPTAEALAPTLFSTERMRQISDLTRLQRLDELLRQQAARSAGVTGAGAGAGAGLLGE